MRKPLLLALLVGVVAGAALAQSAIPLNPARRYELSNCAAAGSAGTAVAAGRYLLRVTDSDTRICLSPTVAPDAGTVCGLSDGGAAGEMLPLGTVMLLEVKGGAAGSYLSCASSSAAGDVHLTLAQ